jgi:hypothetical protein
VALYNPLNGAEPNERFVLLEPFLNYHSKRMANGVIRGERAKLCERTGAFWYHKDNGRDSRNVLLEGDQIVIF